MLLLIVVGVVMTFATSITIGGSDDDLVVRRNSHPSSGTFRRNVFCGASSSSRSSRAFGKELIFPSAHVVGHDDDDGAVLTIACVRV